MSPLTKNISEHFSFKSFAIGLVGVAAIYAGAFGYVALNAEQTLHSLEARLTTQTMLIPSSQDTPITAPPVAHMGEHEEQYGEEGHQEEVRDVPVDHALSEHDIASPPDEAESGEITELSDLIEKKTQSLPPAPASDLVEKRNDGTLLPKANGGRTPFKEYKKPFLLNRNKPALAIAVMDFGLSEDVSAKALSYLPSTVSMILSPYAQDAQKWQKAAREDGHEFWLTLELQNDNFPNNDPGAQAIMNNVSFGYNRERLYQTLSHVSGYAGIAAFNDGTLEASGSMFNNLIKDVFKRGLGYFELNSSHNGNIRSQALDRREPYTENFGTFKNLTPDSAGRTTVENHLKSAGGAVIVVKPSLKNLEDLRNWIRQLERDGVQIVPVSSIAALTTE